MDNSSGVNTNPFTPQEVSEWASFGPRRHRKPATREELDMAKERKVMKKRVAARLGWTEKRVEHALNELVQEQANQRDWEAVFPRYPSTGDGYMESYAPTEPDKYLAALQKYGVVVIQTLPVDVCEEAVQGLQDEANRLQRDCAKKSIDLEDSTTWNNENWPSGNKFLFDLPTVCPAAWKVRLHPNMRRIFSEIYQGKQRLVSSIDKWLVARGTRDITITSETGETVHRERVLEWEQSLPLHVHLDPWRYRDEQHKDGGPAADGEYVPSIMGVVALVDCPQGGHMTIPGSAPFLDAWAAENVDLKPDKPAFSYYIHKKEKCLGKYSQIIPLRKGEMVIWDMRQFHGTTSNTSSKPRIAQFVRYIPSDVWFQQMDRFSPNSVYERWPELRTQTEESLKVLGYTSFEEKCLAGLLSWNQEETQDV